MAVLFQIALRNLVQARRRTMLIFTALALVTVLLLLLDALSKGITETMIRQATTLSAGHVNVAGFYKARVDTTAPLVTGTARLRELVEANVDGLDYLVDRHRGWARVISPTGSIQSGLSGVDIEREARFIERIQLAPQSDYRDDGSDRVVGDIHRLAEPNTAMIFAAQAKRLGVDVGDMLTLSTQTFGGMSNTTEVRIVAVAKDVGFLSNWSVFVPKEVIYDLYRLNDDTTGAIMIYLKDPSRADAVRVHLDRVLREAGYEVMDHRPEPFFAKFQQVLGEDWTGQKLDLTTWEDEVSFMKPILSGIDSISFILIAILVVIIALGIMNTMWIAVRERTREVGTLRAIGMSKERVWTMFMVEALLLGLAATVTGSALGLVVVAGVDAAHIEVPWVAVQAILMSDILHLAFDPWAALKAIAAFTLLAGLASLMPAIRAARMKPITAIHHVG